MNEMITSVLLRPLLAAVSMGGGTEEDLENPLQCAVAFLGSGSCAVLDDDEPFFDRDGNELVRLGVGAYYFEMEK